MKISLKNKLLFAGTLLLFLASYKLAIRNSIAALHEYRELTSRSDLTGDIPEKIAILRQKEIYFDSILSKMDLGDTSIQNNLLRVLNQEAMKNEIRVMDFNEPHTFIEDGHRTNTYSFNLKGGYGNILKTIHNIEQKGNFGKVVHLYFEKKKNYRTKESYLEVTVFVQHMQ